MAELKITANNFEKEALQSPLFRAYHAGQPNCKEKGIPQAEGVHMEYPFVYL